MPIQTFNPDELNDESEFESQDSDKVICENREVVDAILHKQNVDLALPKIFYNSKDLESQQLIPSSLVFNDELIKQYLVSNIGEEQVIITVVPKDAAPFYVVIENGKPQCNRQLLDIYTKTSKLVSLQQGYAHSKISGLISVNEQGVISNTGLPYSIVTDMGNAQVV